MSHILSAFFVDCLSPLKLVAWLAMLICSSMLLTLRPYACSVYSKMYISELLFESAILAMCHQQTIASANVDRSWLPMRMYERTNDLRVNHQARSPECGI